MEMMIRLILRILVLVSCSSFASAEEINVHDLIKAQFPNAENLAAQSLLLTEKQVEELKKEPALTLEGRLFRYFLLKDDEVLKGIALIDTHKVRTQSESLLYIFDSEAKLLSIDILAFKEPDKYKPGQEMLKRSLKLQDSKKLAAIKTGATLTSYALERSRRRAFALYKIIREKH